MKSRIINSKTIVKTTEVKEFNEFYLAMMDKSETRTLLPLERDAIGTVEDCRKVESQLVQIFTKCMRRLSQLKLRIRIMRSQRGATRLMYKMLMSGRQNWQNAFYEVVGRVPTDREVRELMKLRSLVIKGKINHSSSTRVWIGKPGTDEKRPLNVPAIADRIIGKVILDVLGPLRERTFQRNSSGFRMGYDRIKAMIRLMNDLTETSRLKSVDVRKCFDRIPHDLLIKTIQKWKLPEGYTAWAISSLTAEIRNPETGEVTIAEMGTPQGGILSPLLCNEALDELDKEMSNQIYDRYADNILIAEEQLDRVKEYLKERQLEIKESAIDTLALGSSIIHLGCELILSEVKKLTVWYKRITPIYPPRPVKLLGKVRNVLPKLKADDPRRALAGLTGYFSGKGNIQLGAKLRSPYNGTEHWINPFDSESSKDDPKYLAWTGIALYGSNEWYASKTSWTKSNGITGKGTLTKYDHSLAQKIRSGGETIEGMR